MARVDIGSEDTRKRNPDALDKINYVVESIQDPCDAPWQLYVRTAFDAALKAVLIYYALDLMQVFTSYMRPNPNRGNIRNWGHGKRRKPPGKGGFWSTKLGRWISVDPSDWAGNNLPGADDMHNRRVNYRVYTMWTIYGVMERFAYWVFIFNLTVDFFYDWASAVRMSEYCQQQSRGWLTAMNPEVVVVTPLANTPVGLPIIVKQRGPVYWAGSAGGTTAKSWTAILTGSCTPRDGAGDQVRQLWLMTSSGGNAYSEPNPDNPDEFTCAVSGQGPSSFTAMAGPGGPTRITNATLTVMLNPGSAFEAD